MTLDLMTFLKIAGGGIAFIVTSGFTFMKLYDVIQARKEKRKEKEDDRSYKRELQLERDKVEIQKELEATKQRHVQKLIDTIKCEMGKLEKEVRGLSTSFARVDERMKVTVETEARTVEMVNDFIATTKNRFRMMEAQMKQRNGELVKEFKTEIIKIKEDLILVKSIADKVRNKK